MGRHVKILRDVRRSKNWDTVVTDRQYPNLATNYRRAWVTIVGFCVVAAVAASIIIYCMLQFVECHTCKASLWNLGKCTGQDSDSSKEAIVKAMKRAYPDCLFDISQPDWGVTP